MTITLGMMTGENHLLAETPDAVLNPAGAEAEAMEIRPGKKTNSR